MRLLSTLIVLGLIGAGGWWTWNNVPQVRQFVHDNFDAGEFHTLEARYGAEQIMEMHRNALLADDSHSFRRPELLFYPYLLMEVKYSDEAKNTREGMMLWGLDDGEVVIDANTWEKTHGFEDCINAGAGRDDYKVISTLASNGNAMTRTDLEQKLYVQEEMLDRWLESCRKKKLIVQNGEKVRLHFARPKLNITPETKLKQSLVTKTYHRSDQVPRRYSASQVEKAAQLAFGHDFTVRYKREVFLPVHRIVVQNPDGTLRTSHYNALNGKEMPNSLF